MTAASSVTARNSDSITLLGVTIQPRSLQEMNMLVEEGIRECRKWIISNHNLHGLYLFHRHARLREFYSRVQWTHIDGMPLLALGHCARGLPAWFGQCAKNLRPCNAQSKR